MRYLETILKILFLFASVYLVVTKAILSPFFVIFLVVCLLLGVCLIFNKHASYNFQQTPRDLGIRRVEGVILLIFAVGIYVFIKFNS